MTKNNDYDWTTDYNSPKYAVESKAFNAFAKVVMGSCIAILISTILGAFGIITLPIFLIIAVLVVPTVFIAATKFKNNADKNYKRHMYEAGMLRKYMQEAFTKEHKIDKNTAYFMREIRESKIDMSIDNLLNINQLIYLINQNYYEKIIGKTLNISRHELIIKVLEQVKLYIEKTHRNIEEVFDYQDACEIINSCFFIPDEIKKEILHDFSSSRVSVDNRTSFVIEPVDDSFKNISPEQYFNTKEYVIANFDINDIEEYERLMRIYKEMDNNPYRDAFLVEWDLEAIRDCMALIVRRFGLIIENRGEDLFHCEMAATFMYNLCAYASVNKVSHVGIKEIINTFKNWSYFDHNLKVDIVDAIFEEFDLDYSMHPYRKKKKNKDVGKIYNFFSNRANKK